jgi:hypothetical protein
MPVIIVIEILEAVLLGGGVERGLELGRQLVGCRPLDFLQDRSHVLLRSDKAQDLLFGERDLLCHRLRRGLGCRCRGQVKTGGRDDGRYQETK